MPCAAAGARGIGKRAVVAPGRAGTAPPPDPYADTCALEPAGAATDAPPAPAPPPPAPFPRPPGVLRPVLEEDSSAPPQRLAGPAPRPRPTLVLALEEASYDTPSSGALEPAGAAPVPAPPPPAPCPHPPGVQRLTI